MKTAKKQSKPKKVPVTIDKNTKHIKKQPKSKKEYIKKEPKPKKVPVTIFDKNTIQRRETNMKTKKSLAVVTAWMLLLCTLALFAGCRSTQTKAPDELDLAIREASNYLNTRLAAGAKVAYINMQSDSPTLSEYIIEGLIENTVNDGLNPVVDRNQLDAIRAELNFQYSGEVSDDSAQAIGKMLGAQTIITGGVTKMGDLYRLRVRALNVETAQIQGQFSRNVPNGYTITALMSSGGTRTGAANYGTSTRSGNTSANASTGSASTAAQPAQVYKVGDIGPAGGLIFYVKNNNSGGWRYMEAAPADFDQLMVAVTEEFNVANCKGRAVGEGKFNTQGIMAEAARRGGGFGWAAQACDSYELNGYDDWFLPSRDELSQMYGNLHLKGLGNFRDAWYWTSTLEEPSWEFHGWGVHFGTGEQRASGVHSRIRVRAARRF